jgi:dihydroorotate dehydrogenase (NAD+) catalytic subunit
VGTATVNDPSAPVRFGRELSVLLQDKGFERLTDAVGVAHGRLA